MAVVDAAPVRSVEVLVDGARRGDADAWEVLYRRLYPRLYSYAGHRAGFQNAPDIVGETVARAVAGVRRYRRGGSFDAWVFGICRHVIAEQLRDVARRDPVPVGDAATLDPSPEDQVVFDEERRALRKAFSRLERDERELLELRVVAGLSAAEVATVVHKRPGAVRMAQSRALARLRQLWHEVNAEKNTEKEVSR